MSGNAIRTIAVAGGGIVGLSAALAFARSLPKTTITVIETPGDPAALADRLPTAWPTIGRFHATIGLDELDLVRQRIAAHHVGTIFKSAGGTTWVHAFGPHAKPVGSVQFDQIWLRAKETGQARPHEAYSPAAVLARANKFVHPSRDPNSLFSSFVYGLRLDPDLYRARLQELAKAVGIRFISARLGRIECQSGRICALALGTGERVEADLFLDCSGPAARLIQEVDDSFEAWPSHLASSVLIDEVGLNRPSPVARTIATQSGWTAEWPLWKRVIRCTAGRDLSNGLRIRPGRRTRPWTGNVLALGDAATAIDPLHGLNLDLAHRAILLALELLPGRDFSPLELAEYNRRSLLMTDQVRDFLALHYPRNDPAEIPEGLGRRLDQYRYRGRLPFQEDEVLGRDDWTAALIGLGSLPSNIDPAAASVPLDRAVEAMEKIALELASTAERLPAYETYVSQLDSRR